MNEIENKKQGNSGFLYFRERDQSSVGVELLGSLGLSHIVDGETAISSRPTTGNKICGAGGVVFADESRHLGQKIGFYGDLQTWRKMPNDSDIWFGYWNERPPVPEALARDKMLRGATVRIGNKHKWQIPIVRSYDDKSGGWENRLPAYIDYDDTGKMVLGDPLETYAALWEATAPLACQSYDEGTIDGLDDMAVWDAVVALISANYVVSMPELVSMKAINSDDGMALAVMASCRYDELMEWIGDAKKNEIGSPERAS